MSRLDATLAYMAPGVAACRDADGVYNPRRGLAIYCLPMAGYSPSSPGVVLGEALAARSGLGCTLLEGIPDKVPESAVIVGQYSALKALRPDLVADIPELSATGEYAIKLNRSAVIVSPGPEGLAAGMQTLSMLILRHGEDVLPGCIITDQPAFHTRGLAVELDSGEISISLLMQIASFAATFKANSLHFILNDDFESVREIPGIETFSQTCQSYGIRVGVRLPLLGPLLRGKRTPNQVWASVRAAARLFLATEAALDDACPEAIPDAACIRVTESLAKGDSGLKHFSIDAAVLARSAVPVAELKAAGVSGWYRPGPDGAPPPEAYAALPMIIDVQAPLPAFSAACCADYHEWLDQAVAAAAPRDHKELFVSFRSIGISHMWQNMLYPAATGLITGWGRPALAEDAAWRYSNLLYGDSARAIMNMWETVSAAFPTGLNPAEERLVRRTAFGHWPRDEDWPILTGINWLEVTKRIRSGADALKNAAADLSRNALTLAGARLGLYALSWLHCFVALEPELARRRRLRIDDDGRTEPIANELYNNFTAWHAHLQEVYAESGLDFSEMDKLEAMGLRLKGLCDGIFE